ncbi:MAG: 30S ribosomal protein S16 [Candidatus Falkowbacteria bacterium]
MLTIKFARKGKKGMPMYRLIVSEKGRDTYGNPLEILGSYNPHNKHLDVKADRVKHWISVGAQMTGVVNNLFVEHKVVDGKKLRVSRLSKKVRQDIKKKADEEKKKGLEAKKTAAEEAARPEPVEVAKAAEEVAKPVEAPVEEAPVVEVTPVIEAPVEETPAQEA